MIRSTGPAPGPVATALSLAFAAFGLTVALAWIYVWLVVFTIPEKLEGSWMHSVVGIAGLSLHLLFKDHSLHEANHDSHMRWGRWVLALKKLAQPPALPRPRERLQVPKLELDDIPERYFAFLRLAASP